MTREERSSSNDRNRSSDADDDAEAPVTPGDVEAAGDVPANGDVDVADDIPGNGNDGSADAPSNSDAGASTGARHGGDTDSAVDDESEDTVDRTSGSGRSDEDSDSSGFLGNLKSARSQLGDAKEAFSNARGAGNLPTDEEGRVRIVCRRYEERRLTPLDDKGRPTCYEAGNEDCESCVEAVSDGEVGTW